MRVGADDVEYARANYRLDRALAADTFRVLLNPSMSPSALRRQIGQLLIAGFNGHQIPTELRSLAQRVRPRRRHPLRAQHRRARAGRRAVPSRRRGCVPDLPAWVVGRSGRRARRAAEGAVHRMAADGDARAQRRRRAGRALRARAGAELKAVGITLDYAPVLDIHTNPKNPVIGDRALAEKAEDVARLGARDRPDAAGAKASPPAASTFPGTATPAPIRTSSCRWSSIRPIGCARSSSCRSRPRSTPAWRRS